MLQISYLILTYLNFSHLRSWGGREYQKEMKQRESWLKKQWENWVKVLQNWTLNESWGAFYCLLLVVIFSYREQVEADHPLQNISSFFYLIPFDSCAPLNGDPSIEPTFHCERGPIHFLMENVILPVSTKTNLPSLSNIFKKLENERK